MIDVISKIVADETLHAKWLNTLSFMENAGARKISKSEDKTKVSLIQLKHAAEEHRHAYYLKKQIQKLNVPFLIGYEFNELLTPKNTRFYLHALDMKCCRYLKKELMLTDYELKYAAYLFVTYVIELRADELYPIYQEELTRMNSKVMVKSIILEEEGHLEEMLTQLKSFDPNWEKHAARIHKIEQTLFNDWMVALKVEVNAQNN